MLVISRTGASLSAERPAMAYVSDMPYTNWQRLTLSAPLNSPAVRRVGESVGGRRSCFGSGLREAARICP